MTNATRIGNSGVRVSASAKGCQVKPAVFPRNSLKTNRRAPQQVTIFRGDSTRIAVPSEHCEARGASRISTRQCCRIESAVTHSKETVGTRATRQFFEQSSNPIFEPPISICGPWQAAPHARFRRDVMYIAREQKAARRSRTRSLHAPRQGRVNDTISFASLRSRSQGPASQFTSRRRRRAHV